MLNAEKSPWPAPGRPWEVELFALLFVLLALVLPFSIHNAADPQPAMSALVHAMGSSPDAAAAGHRQGMLWAIGVLVLFALHISTTRADTRHLSMSFQQLIAPLFFSCIAYYRILATAEVNKQISVVATGRPGQLVLWIAVVVAVTILLARLRMARLFLNYRDDHWDVVEHVAHDHPSFRALGRFFALAYLPRWYRASENGILIEGWFYVMQIPFADVQSMTAVPPTGAGGIRRAFAPSARPLLRVEFWDNSPPIALSPRNRDEFLRYGVQRLARSRTAAPAVPASRPHGGPVQRPSAAGGTSRDTSSATSFTGVPRKV